jgi:hypothetical protein
MYPTRDGSIVDPVSGGGKLVRRVGRQGFEAARTHHPALRFFAAFSIEIVPPPGWPICKCKSKPGVRCAIADQGLIGPILLAAVHGRPPFALSGRSIS